MTTGAVIHAIAASGPVAAQRSPWHSPVPYLFGGLAAMLGLIAFALLILTCSYWKLSGDQENGETERDLEAGEGGEDALKAAPVVFEEKFLVIMAGHEKPTYLATPISSRASSFGSNSTTSCCSCSTESTEKTEEKEDKEENNSASGGDDDDSTNQQNQVS